VIVRALVALAAAALATPPLEAALTVQHQAVGCVLAERHPRLDARFDPEAEVAGARVFFRAAGTPHWYSVAMVAQAGLWSGTLPKPAVVGGRLSAGAIAGIIGGGAVVAGGVVVAGRDGDDGLEEAVPTLTGSWAGTGTDGMSRDEVDTTLTCHREDDLFLDLQQTGSAVTGSARYVSRAGTTCNLEPLGTVRAFPVTGSLAGTSVSLTLQVALPDGASTHIFVGTLQGSRMSGTVTSTFPAGGSHGTWSVRRQ
jgi:hypothetical protein